MKSVLSGYHGCISHSNICHVPLRLFLNGELMYWPCNFSAVWLRLIQYLRFVIQCILKINHRWLIRGGGAGGAVTPQTNIWGAQPSPSHVLVPKISLA